MAASLPKVSSAIIRQLRPQIEQISKFVSASSAHLASEGKKSGSSTPDKVTHTGQVWKEDDYRLARFVETPKQVNERFAIDLIAEIPPKPIKARHVYCDGGGGPLGHPKVYINLDPPGNHSCGYCGLRFVKDLDH